MQFVAKQIQVFYAVEFPDILSKHHSEFNVLIATNKLQCFSLKLSAVLIHQCFIIAKAYYYTVAIVILFFHSDNSFAHSFGTEQVDILISKKQALQILSILNIMYIKFLV